MTKRKYIKIISIILTIGFVLYIYHNSMYAIQQSDIQSGVVLRFLNNLFARMGCNITCTQFIVRKMAHFTEYLIFAVIVTITLRIWFENLKGHLFFQLFVLLAVPVLDESIQMFYKGRNSSVIDVLIDFAGGLVGMGLCYLLAYLFYSIRGRKKLKD